MVVLSTFDQLIHQFFMQPHSHFQLVPCYDTASSIGLLLFSPIRAFLGKQVVDYTDLVSVEYVFRFYRWLTNYSRLDLSVQSSSYCKKQAVNLHFHSVEAFHWTTAEVRFFVLLLRLRVYKCIHIFIHFMLYLEVSV